MQAELQNVDASSGHLHTVTQLRHSNLIGSTLLAESMAIYLQ